MSLNFFLTQLPQNLLESASVIFKHRSVVLYPFSYNWINLLFCIPFTAHANCIFDIMDTIKVMTQIKNVPLGTPYP